MSYYEFIRHFLIWQVFKITGLIQNIRYYVLNDKFLYTMSYTTSLLDTVSYMTSL
jgi:hypothetical protein